MSYFIIWKTVLITSARDCGKKKFLIIFLVDADQDPEQCNEERTLKPITDYDQLFQLVLRYNRFLHLLIDLFKRFSWVVLFIALSTRNWARVIVSLVIEHHCSGLMKMLRLKRRPIPSGGAHLNNLSHDFDRVLNLLVWSKRIFVA